MGLHLLVFMGVAAIVIVIPGPDTAVVTKNVLIHGRRAGLGTSLGVSAGIAIWTIAAAVGVASVVRASEVAFTVLKLVGALYLVWLGVQALRAAGGESEAHDAKTPASGPRLSAQAGFARAASATWPTRRSGSSSPACCPSSSAPATPCCCHSSSSAPSSS